MTMSIAEILTNSLSTDQNVRIQATSTLEKLSLDNFPGYLQYLCQELANEQQLPHIRVSAGVAIKNSLSAKDALKRSQLMQRWISQDATSKQSLKSLMLQSLFISDPGVGMTVAQIVAAISAVELPRKEWPELTQILLQNVTSSQSSPQLKKASLEAIGFICEEIDPHVLSASSNEILTAVVQGARKDESTGARKAALNALTNSLLFIKSNFDYEQERNVIMQVVCEATQDNEEAVAVAAFECLVEIMTIYYDYMMPYMNQGLFLLTINAMQHPNEKIALQSIEFWSTVCDVEIDRQIDALEGNDDMQIFQFSKAALSYILPTLLGLLTKQESEEEDDDWNVAKAAGTCLTLFANCIQDDILNDQNNTIIKFVEQNIVSSDWHHREAAIMSFASILEGPKQEIISPFVSQALPLLIKLMKDPSIAVKDTATWAISRICEVVPSVFDKSQVQQLVHVLIEGLTEPPRVASHCACSLMNLAIEFGSEDEPLETYILSPILPHILSSLYKASQREDATEANLRSAVYQALSSIISYTARDTFPILIKFTETILSQLEHTLVLQTQTVNFDDEMKLSDIQSYLSILIQAVIRKLGGEIKPFADQIMTVFIQILAGSTIHRAVSLYEDILLTIGSLIAETEADFSRYMGSFFPKLLDALRNRKEELLCSIAIGLVGDLARALTTQLVPYCDLIMTCLFETVQDANVSRTLKPPILASFGDVAIAVGPEFQKYMTGVMLILEQASRMSMERDNVDDIDYYNELNESILEAYTCIIQGNKTSSSGDSLLNYIPSILSFVHRISQDSDKSETVARNAIGLLGDLIDSFKEKLRDKIHSETPWIKPFIKEYRKGEEYHHTTIQVANWTSKLLNQL